MASEMAVSSPERVVERWSNVFAFISIIGFVIIIISSSSSSSML